MADVFSIVLGLASVLALVALNGFFVAAEFALVSARRTQLEQLASAGNAAAALSRRMQDDLDRYIAAAQLGITLASLALGWIGEGTIAAMVDPPIEALRCGARQPRGGQIRDGDQPCDWDHCVVFYHYSLHIVLGEQAPKVFAIRAPEQPALFIAHPLAIFNRVFGLVIRFLDWATDRSVEAFGIRENGGHTKVHSAAELRLLVEESGEAGALEDEEQEMLINVFAFADRPAYQAMLPRTEVVTIDHDASDSRVPRSLRADRPYALSGAWARRRR